MIVRFYREVRAIVDMTQSCLLSLEEMKQAIVDLTNLSEGEVDLLSTDEIITKVKELMESFSHAFSIESDIDTVRDIFIEDAYESDTY